MRSTVRLLAACVLLGVGAFVAVPSAQAQTLVSANFNTEAQGLGKTTLSGFLVTRGNIDVIGTGFFDSYPGNGNYIDLDGSNTAGVPAGTTNARITTNSFTFNPGITYTLSFALGKNSGLGTGGESLSVSIGSVFATVISDTRTYPALENKLFTFSVLSSTSAPLVFDLAGPGDQAGYILDNVSLVGQQSAGAAPEPGTLALAGVGSLLMVGMAKARRRRRSAAAV